MLIFLGVGSKATCMKASFFWCPEPSGQKKDKNGKLQVKGAKYTLEFILFLNLWPKWRFFGSQTFGGTPTWKTGPLCWCKISQSTCTTPRKFYHVPQKGTRNYIFQPLILFFFGSFSVQKLFKPTKLSFEGSFQQQSF